MPYKPIFDNLPNEPTYMDVVKAWNKETFGNSLFAFPKKGHAPAQQIKDLRNNKEITPFTTVAEMKKEVKKKEVKKKEPSVKQLVARAKFAKMAKDRKKKTEEKEKSVKDTIKSIMTDSAVIPEKEGTKEEQKKEAKKQEEEAKKQEEEAKKQEKEAKKQEKSKFSPSFGSTVGEEKEITWNYIIEKNENAQMYVDHTSKSQMIKLIEKDYPTLKGENKKKVIKEMNDWRLREIKDIKLAEKAQPLQDKINKIKEELRGDDVTPKKRASLTKQLDEIKKKIDAIVAKGYFVLDLLNTLG